MNPDIKKLQDRISELENTLKSLTFSSDVPRNIQTALEQRLNILTAQGTSATGGTSSYSAFPVVVPATPSGALQVSVNGITYKLLYV